MGAFSTKKTLYGDTARIPQVAEKIRQTFVNEGYEVRIEDEYGYGMTNEKEVIVYGFIDKQCRVIFPLHAQAIQRKCNNYALRLPMHLDN